jgi:hypothetical protein
MKKNKGKREKKTKKNHTSDLEMGRSPLSSNACAETQMPAHD